MDNAKSSTPEGQEPTAPEAAGDDPGEMPPPPEATGSVDGSAGAGGVGDAAKGGGAAAEGGAAQVVEDGATVTSSGADATASIGSAAGSSQVAGGAGVVGGAAGVTGGGAQIAKGDVAGGTKSAVSSAGNVTTSAMGMSADDAGGSSGGSAGAIGGGAADAGQADPNAIASASGDAVGVDVPKAPLDADGGFDTDSGINGGTSEISSATGVSAPSNLPTEGGSDLGESGLSAGASQASSATGVNVPNQAPADLDGGLSAGQSATGVSAPSTSDVPGGSEASQVAGQAGVSTSPSDVTGGATSPSQATGPAAVKGGGGATTTSPAQTGGAAGAGGAGDTGAGAGQAGAGQTGAGQTGAGQTATTEPAAGQTGGSGGAGGAGDTGAGQTGGPGQTATGQTSTTDTGAGQTGTGQTGAGQTDAGQTATTEPGAGQTGGSGGAGGAGDTGAGQAGGAGQTATTPTETGAGQTGAGQTGAGQTGAGQTAPAEPAPAEPLPATGPTGAGQTSPAEPVHEPLPAEPTPATGAAGAGGAGDPSQAGGGAGGAAQAMPAGLAELGPRPGGGVRPPGRPARPPGRPAHPPKPKPKPKPFQPPPWLKDLAHKLSDATSGQVEPAAITGPLTASIREIHDKGGDTNAPLGTVRFGGGAMIAELKKVFETQGIDPRKALGPVIGFLKKWKAQVRPVRCPDPSAKPLRAPVRLGGMTSDQRYDYFKRVVTETMGGQWDDASKGLNVIGVRNFRKWHELKPDSFGWNDTIFCVFKDGDKKCVEGFLASVDPGRRYNKVRPHPAGCAHLADGHYDYKVRGLPFRKITYACPSGPVEYWLDRDNDGEQDEDEETRTGRIGFTIRPGGLNAVKGEWQAGYQLIAGGRRGPWKRFQELLRADPDRKFKYTLIDAAQLPLPRGNRVFIPLGTAKRPVELHASPKSLMRTVRIMRVMESGSHGGFYPISYSHTWHGGGHLPARPGRDHVFACCSGEVVAARLGDIDEGKHKNGSANFVLLRHELPKAGDGGKGGGGEDEKQYWFSLYFHLQPVKDKEFPWVFRIHRDFERSQQAGQGGAGQDMSKAKGKGKGGELLDKWKERAKKAKEALDKAQSGQVSFFEPGVVEIAAGERLGFAGAYGKPKQQFLHFEVFSPGDKDPLIPKDAKRFLHVDAKGESDATKVAKILEFIDIDKDKTITNTELAKAFKDKGLARKLRHVVVTHPSEWWMDWSQVLPDSDYWKKFYKSDELQSLGQEANNYTWYDGKLSDWGISDKVVTHYHPIRFLRWLVQNRKEQGETSVSHMPKGKPWKLPLKAYIAKFVGQRKR
jgi:hypothetical protein